MRDKIRLVSSAGTGYFYTTDKNKRTMPKNSRSKNTIPLCASMLCSKKPKSSNWFAFAEKPDMFGLFHA